MAERNTVYPRVLGVDPGTRVVGYGIVDLLGPARFEYVECGVLKAGGDDLDARVAELAAGLEEVIGEFEPTRLAIECAFHGINASSALKLAEARGAFKLVGRGAGLQIFEYEPAKVKRALVGSGKATKADIQRRVSVLCRLQRAPVSDAADALAIAICHVQAARSGVPLAEAGHG
jgi:crossover junction endodeoxyribonuclease RuvC